jgi:hypothetical protein
MKKKINIILLFASIVLLSIFNENENIFILTAFIGSIIGVYYILIFIRQPNLIRFANIMAVSLLLGYALSTTVYVGGRLLSDQNMDLTSNFFGLGYYQSDLSIALLLVYLTCIILFFLARLEKPIFNQQHRTNIFASSRSRLLIWVGMSMVFCAFALGDIGYMGVQLDESLNISPFGAVTFLLAPILMPLTALSFFEETSVNRRILLSLTFVFFLVVLFPLGRRVLLSSFLLLLISFVVSEKNIQKFSLIKWTGSAFTATLTILICYLAFQFFFALRTSVDYLGQETTFLTLLSNTFNLLQFEYSDIEFRLADNIRERPFILSYLAAFICAQSTYPPLYGEELIYAIKIAIPSLFFPSKTLLLPGSPEEFVHPAFGFYIFDGPNTIITAGLNDFGLIGILIYPIILATIYIAIRRFLQDRLPQFIYYLVMFRLIYQIFYIEQSLAGMITVGLRDLAIITSIYYFIWKLPSILKNSYKYRY